MPGKLIVVGDDDLYRRNPARDVEQFAIRVVTGWVADRGDVEDLSAGHEPDFRISYADGRIAYGEVGWYQDPVEQAMWGATFRQERHHVIALPDGRGRWAVHLVLGANIKKLYNELPRFIECLLEGGQDQLEIEGDWPTGELPDHARRLGIEYISLVEQQDPAWALYMFGGAGGVVPQDPDVISAWISDVLADPNYRDTTAKLLARACDERHVFLMSGSLTPFGVDERLRRVTDALPVAPPSVPDGITHVWVTPRFGPDHVALWSPAGWSAVAC